jgi:hypothetical protein
MKKLDHPVLDHLIDTVKKIHAGQDRLAELKDRLQEEARAIGDIGCGKTRLEIAAYAYWYLQEVHAMELVLAVTKRRNIHHFLELVGPFVSDVSCGVCGESLPVTSRGDMERVLAHRRNDRGPFGSHAAWCDRCREIEWARWKAETAKEDRKRQARYAVLRAMSYDEYRQTPDWRHQRAQYLALQLDMGGMDATQRCEACNSATVRLDVYHKSLDRLGHEYFSNLIVLCPDCRDALHEHGRLAA